MQTTAVTDRELAVRTLEKMLQHAHEGHVQAVAVAWGRCDWPRQCDLVPQQRRVDARRGFIAAISVAEYARDRWSTIGASLGRRVTRLIAALDSIFGKGCGAI